MISATTPTAPKSLLSCALAYAHQGWPVLPLQPRGKVPLVKHGVYSATTVADTIRAWWRRWPQANIGIAIPPGLVVVDIDSSEALQYLRAEGLELPATVRSTTGRGLHLWYATDRFQAQNHVGLLPSVDIKVAGGYIVSPPSLHSSGKEYRWEVELRRSFIAPCPDWLLEKLKNANVQPVRHTAQGWAKKLREVVPEGRRNKTLTEVCGLFFRKLPAEVAAEATVCWAAVRLQPPLSDAELEQTLASISGRELRRRGGA